MIATLEDHYRWDAGRRRFVRLEDELLLVAVEPDRANLQATRVTGGWELLTSVRTELSSQLGAIDVWIRVNDLG